MTVHYVFLKTKANDGTSLTTNIIPLKITEIGITTEKSIPAFNIPLSGVATGESVRAALDLGMATKRLNLTGFITDDFISKTFDGDTSQTNLFFTAHEIAQMIHSGVDSTGLAQNQAFSELVILMPSFVDKDYVQRAGIDTTDISTATLIPFTFHSRGEANTKDNYLVPLPTTFPNSQSDDGLGGFIRSFNCTLAADSVEIGFTMDFEVASILP